MKGKLIIFDDRSITILTKDNERLKFRLTKCCMITKDGEFIELKDAFHEQVKVLGTSSKFKYEKNSIIFEGVTRFANTIEVLKS